jgi:O-antigen/teichoic acid export membrane protein
MTRMLKEFYQHTKTHRERVLRLSKEGAWVIVGQISVLLASLVLMRVLTSRLSPNQYGEIALGLALAGLLNQVVMGGITAGIGRYYSIASEENDLGSYLGGVRYLVTSATIVLLVIGLAFISWRYFIFDSSDWLGLIVTSLAFSIFTSWKTSISCIQNAARQRVIVATHGALDAWLRIVLALAAILWLGASSTAVLIGYICSTVLTIFFQLAFFFRTILLRQSAREGGKQWRRKIWNYSIPVSIWGSFLGIQQVSDRWALEFFSTTHDVGQYAVLYQLGFSPVILAGSVTLGFLTPILYQRSGDATNKERNSAVHILCWRIILVSLVATFITFLIAMYANKWIFEVIVAEEYRYFSYLLPWLVLSAGLFSCGQLLNLKLESELRPMVMVTAKVSASIIGISLNIIGSILMGIEGVVIAMVVFSAIYFIWMAILGRDSLVKLASD